MRKKTGFMISIVAALLFAILVYNVFPLRYRADILQNAAQNDLDPALIAAQIFVESGFEEKAVSKKNAVGLMQIRPDTAAWFAKKNQIGYSENDLMQSRYNIMLGCRYLKYLLVETGDMEWALAAYNAGLSRVRQWQASGIERVEDIPYPETAKYVKKVLQIKKIYSTLYVFKEI